MYMPTQIIAAHITKQKAVKNGIFSNDDLI